VQAHVPPLRFRKPAARVAPVLGVSAEVRITPGAGHTLQWSPRGKLSTPLDLRCKKHTPPPQYTPPPGCAAQQSVLKVGSSRARGKVDNCIPGGALLSAASGASGGEIAPYWPSGRTANPAQSYACRGPRSMCRQSRGIKLSGSTGPPPPQRRPALSTMFPQRTFMKLDALSPREMSTPVAGQVRCVLTSSGAVGRP